MSDRQQAAANLASWFLECGRTPLKTETSLWVLLAESSISKLHLKLLFTTMSRLSYETTQIDSYGIVAQTCVRMNSLFFVLRDFILKIIPIIISIIRGCSWTYGGNEINSYNNLLFYCCSLYWHWHPIHYFPFPKYFFLYHILFTLSP